MLFGWFFGDWTLLIVFPALIFSVIAQIKVQTTFRQYSKVYNRHGLTAAEAARRILDANGLSHIRIERIGGHLTDHYDPRANVIRLSESVYGSTSAAALGVAAHEAGHACQHAFGYLPLKIRSAIIPITNFASQLAMPTFLLGLLFAGGASSFGSTMMLIGILLFSTSTLFQLVTLPTEFNASSRALRSLDGQAILDQSELAAARKTLSAAAMTYVAALATSLLSLLRLLLIFRSRSDD